MKNHLKLVASNDENLDEKMNKPPLINRERFFNAFKMTLPIMRYSLFVVLLFFRVPVNFLSRLLVGPLILFAVIWGFIAGWTSTAALALGGAAFVVFILSFAFDSLIMALAPEGYIMEV